MDDFAKKAMDDFAKEKSMTWYSVSDPRLPGEAHSLNFEGQPFKRLSNHHTETSFKSESYGVVCDMDGVHESSELTGASYYEMLTHLPLCSHQNPKKVLIIGDRCGSIVKEVLRHHSVEEIYTSVKDMLYYPPHCEKNRVRLCSQEVNALFEFKYDVIIVDPLQAVVSEERLFDGHFYELVAKALNQGGVFCTRVQNFWYEKDVPTIVNRYSNIFKGKVNYAWAQIPLYPSGAVGFILCTTEGSTVSFENPINQVPEDPERPLHFYDPEVHSAAFSIPPFAMRCEEEK